MLRPPNEDAQQFRVWQFSFAVINCLPSTVSMFKNIVGV